MKCFTRLFIMMTLTTLATAQPPAESQGEGDPATYTLSICAIFQNEAQWLKEWIEYHRIVGVEHFFLFNHLSQDHFREVLQPYVDSGVVDLIDWYGPTQVLSQKKAYSHCLRTFGHKSKWIAFLDVDEFIVPVDSNDLREFLERFEEFGALAINWLFFGTSDVESLQPGELLIERLTRCAEARCPNNNQVKCIVRPSVATGLVNVHQFTFTDGLKTVDTDRMPVYGRGNPRIPLDQLRINHYWTRTADWAFGEKLTRLRRPRRDAEGNPASYRWDEASLREAIETFNARISTCEDQTIQRFVPSLRERLMTSESARQQRVVTRSSYTDTANP